MLMTTGFLSFVFLEHSFKSDKLKTIFVVLSSILVSISTLVHLNGVVFVITGGLILIIKKQNRNMLWYMLTSLPFVFWYFSHLDSISGICRWYNQLMAYNSGSVEVGFNLGPLYIGDNAGNYLVVGKTDELTVLVKNEIENALSQQLN